MAGNFALYDDLVVRMVSELPGCPSAIVKQELQKTGYRFFADSGVWLETLTPLDIVSGQQDYELEFDGDAQVYQIQRVRLKGESGDEFDQIAALDPSNYYLKDDSYLSFYSAYAPQYSLPDGMEIQLMLVPTWTAQGLPINLINRYALGIMSGAKFELMKMPKKSWTNTDLAQYYRQEYFTAVSEAARDKYVEGRNTVIQAAIPSFL